MDHLRALVERIASGLAGASYPGLERVVEAVSGEPPSRFRARVLLERAAYRMVASEDTLRDIAAESGFPSAQVFNRAFRREHGALPSAWRADPTTHLLDAPNDVHFHPPAGLRLPPRRRMDGVDLVVEMVEHHVLLLGELVDRAALVADAALDVPLDARLLPAHHPRVHTPREALSGMVTELEQLSALVHDTAHVPVPERESVASLRRRLDRGGPAFVDDVSLLAATGRFDETFVDAATSVPSVLSFGAMVREVLVDSGHLRLLVRARLEEIRR